MQGRDPGLGRCTTRGGKGARTVRKSRGTGACGSNRSDDGEMIPMSRQPCLGAPLQKNLTHAKSSLDSQTLLHCLAPSFFSKKESKGRKTTYSSSTLQIFTRSTAVIITIRFPLSTHKVPFFMTTLELQITRKRSLRTLSQAWLRQMQERNRGKCYLESLQVVSN